MNNDLDLSQAPSVRPEKPKGPLCPFMFQAIVDPIALSQGGLSVMQHVGPCVKEECALWDNINNQCDLRNTKKEHENARKLR